MMFHEIYGSYFNVTAAVLKEAVLGKLTDEKMTELIMEKAFSESLVTVPALFTPDMFVWFDQYCDGDPYESQAYIGNFRTVLNAFRQKRLLRINFTGHRGKSHSWVCVPYWLEYSLKDDKFRMITTSPRNVMTINLARIETCSLLEPYSEDGYKPPVLQKEALVLEVQDERNALERVMLHFSHLQKETERIEADRYRLTLYYDKDDETELLIRVMSFGPLVKVLSPNGFIAQIKERLQKQKTLIEKNCEFK
ncbi:WYL domain-containing protein [Anaerovorax odorimutans]|uniref:WYL domain-containing protein n=1 Tax=Anaerovorax odorimutans TaxID=109327 RepID=A0ABT1RRC7_9FIRM|nr:WYL domain-containing protein [Anaerovorax odorimutans]MCQ4637711.1 WYL domain-containing protein [Anaerovorax odorimutans]